MTEAAQTANLRAELNDRGVRLLGGDRSIELHPLWLRERSKGGHEVDARTSQRLYAPAAVPLDLAVVSCSLDASTARIDLNDGTSLSLDLHLLLIDIGWVSDIELPPLPVPWSAPLTTKPVVDWPQLLAHDREYTRDALAALFRDGYLILTGVDCVDGRVGDVANFFGRIAPTTFGAIFDVVSAPNSVDLAYSSLALAAHSDMPYRRPVPGLQLLHTLKNDTDGGDSLLVDGFAAAAALRETDADGYAVLTSLPIDFRYDIGTDAMRHQCPIIELDVHGEPRCIRFSPRIDYAPPAPTSVLDLYYRARAWLAEWLNSADHMARFRLQSGEVMLFDNHRILHGRTAFNDRQGERHLQGAYIDHDGIHTHWQLLQRSHARSNETHP